MIMAGEEEDRQKGFRMLGILDVKTPCAREAVLHGAGGAVVSGLIHFLTTSRVRRSFDVGFAGFMLTTLGSWWYCRTGRARLLVQQRVLQDGLKNKVAFEGTSRDPGTKTPRDPGQLGPPETMNTRDPQSP
ncbi:cytochrome c oxidase assembly protein COX20, mitochondrial [Gadus morhua]|uniref:Cytochrome c oxidase assembly protein COX20, mitochondrial n=1 Tax=Gadus morhua TaxID=8049 RepID=A0A8C5A1L3_GADMO|nr:cytochrome c oxidase assembly protein COX20, mitochondrial [Gadus morhua]XP_056465375.1 cytochrome c oxidase assembly protein COX20, mitochondrial [Gadus chalcogrammus]